MLGVFTESLYYSLSSRPRHLRQKARLVSSQDLIIITRTLTKQERVPTDSHISHVSSQNETRRLQCTSPWRLMQSKDGSLLMCLSATNLIRASGVPDDFCVTSRVRVLYDSS